METILKLQACVPVNDYLATIAEGVFEDWLLTAEGEPTPLSRFASFNPSTYSPKEKWPVVAYVDTGSVTRNHFDKPMVIDTATEKLPSRARRKVEDGDVIYSTVRPNQFHYGLVCNPPSNMLVSTGFTVARDSVGVGGPFIYLALTRPSITAKLQSVAEQSTSAYPSIKSSDLEQLEIPMPTKDEIEEIKPQLDSLFAAIAHNEYESKMLEELRDTLLSKLMSGEIDVSQIELPMQPNNHLSLRAIEMSNLNDLLIFEVPALLRKKVETKRKVHSILIRLIDCVLLNPDAFRHPSNTARVTAAGRQRAALE